MTSRLQNAVILGGGSAGLLTAVALRRLLPELKVTLVRSPNIPVIGVGESTTTYVPKFLHTILGLDRRQFFERVEPVWKLGIRFEWGAPAESHFNYSFDNMMIYESPSLRKPAAFYCLDDAGDAGHFSALMDRCLAPCVATAQGHMVAEGVAYHINNPKFLAYLEGKADEFGAEIISGDVVAAAQNETGDVTHLQLDDGRTIEGDLFFDCSGFRSVLLSKYFDQDYVSYAGALCCDRTLVGNWQRDDAVQPYTTAETMRHGWCWRIDFLDHVNRGYVYCSQFCDADEAAEEMRATNPQLGDDLELIEFPSGRLENFWVRNVIAIGNAAAFVEPLESSALHMAAETVAVVCSVLRDSDLRLIPEVPPIINRIFRRKWDDIRDFLALHYRFNRRVDSPFWRHCREHTDLGGAGAVVDLYRKIGPSATCIECIAAESIFQFDGYMTQLIGQRVTTEFVNDLSDEDRQAWRARQQQVRHEIAGAIPVREATAVVRGPNWQWSRRGV